MTLSFITNNFNKVIKKLFAVFGFPIMSKMLDSKIRYNVLIVLTNAVNSKLRSRF